MWQMPAVRGFALCSSAEGDGNFDNNRPMSEFLKAVQDRVVIYDGAMGTSVQARQPSLDDFWGNEGCNDILVLSRPDIIRDIPASFSTADKPRFVAGSFGPTTKLPSLGHIGFDDMASAYEEQAAALIEGGV